MRPYIVTTHPSLASNNRGGISLLVNPSVVFRICVIVERRIRNVFPS